MDDCIYKLWPDLPKKMERRVRKWESADEPYKFTNERAKLFCPYSSFPVGDIRVTSNTISMQDNYWAMVRDKNGSLNILFKGVCLAPSQPKPPLSPPPCASVINLGDWKGYSDVHVNNDYALVKSSTIMCYNSCEDISFLHSGQVAQITDFMPFIPQLLIIKLVNRPDDVTVCHKVQYLSYYMEYGEPEKNDNIEWFVHIGEDSDSSEKEFKLTTLKNQDIILGEDSIVEGREVKFPVPKEWGKYLVRFEARLKSNGKITGTDMPVYMKDHIVAAFFRIDEKNPIFEQLDEINEEKGTKNLLFPVHHHQGLYRNGDTIYISGSVKKGCPAYFYQIKLTRDEKSYEQLNPVLLNKGMQNQYRHPGGLQCSNGIMAIGAEEYNDSLIGFFGSYTNLNSIVCFLDDEMNEIPNIRIARDEDYGKKIKKIKKEYQNKEEIWKEYESDENLSSKIIQGLTTASSAVGIVYIGQKKGNTEKKLIINEWLVGVRGGEQRGEKSVDFYKIWETGEIMKDEKGKEIKDKKGNLIMEKNIREVGSSNKLVGEFQNMNLFLNEKDEVYLFGMGKSQMEGDRCRLYKLDLVYAEESPTISQKTSKTHTISDIQIKSAWIEDGYLQEDAPYVQDTGTYTEKNELDFKCISPVTFHWASCMYIHFKNKTDAEHNHTTGFKGYLCVYATNDKVANYRIDHEKAKALYEIYKKSNSPFNADPKSPDGSNKEYMGYNEFSNLPHFRIPLNRSLLFNTFTEKKLNLSTEEIIGTEK